jgi:hypothetical protein
LGTRHSPRPLFSKGRKISGITSGRASPASAKVCVWTQRHCEEHLRRRNPAFSFAARWIASLALAMTTVYPLFEN